MCAGLASQLRRIDALEKRGETGRRLFVVPVPYGDAQAKQAAKDRLVAERGLTKRDMVIFLQRFSPSLRGVGSAIEYRL
jgi:hypothetical protein